MRHNTPEAGRRVLIAVSVICWLLMIAAWFPASVIEREALRQPPYRTEQFTEPLRVKGTIRHVTPIQRDWHVAATTAFHAGWFLGALATIAVLA